VNELRIDPDPVWVARLLAVAGRLAARDSGGDHPLADPAEQERAVARLRDQREGLVEWSAKVDPWMRETGFVTLGWWGDALGRKHVRVMTARIDSTSDYPPRETPPIAFVYPGQAITRTEGSWAADHLFACACGAAGTAADIAWTGERCGPCHDRRLEGHLDLPSTIADGWNHEGGPVAFTPDGRGVVGVDGGRLTLGDLTTGRREVADHAPRRHFSGAATSPDGRVCIGAFQPGGVLRWDRATGRVTAHRIEHDAASFFPCPDGRHVVVDDGRACYRVEWDNARQPLWPEWRFAGGCPGTFSRDGKTWYGVADFENPPAARFVAVTVASGRATELRRNSFRKTRFGEYGTECRVICAFHPETDRVAACEDGGGDDLGPGDHILLGSIRRASEWQEVCVGEASPMLREETARDYLKFSPCGDWLAARVMSGIKFWPMSGEPPYRLAVPHPGRLDAPTFAFSPDGSLMAVAYQAGESGFVRVLPWRRLVESGSS